MRSSSATKATSQLAKNNHWLAVKLIGVKSNRNGIGSLLKLIAGNLTSYDQSKGGMSYCSAQDREFIRAGPPRHVDYLEIRWPSGYVQQLKNIPADTVVYVTEGVNAVAKNSVAQARVAAQLLGGRRRRQKSHRNQIRATTLEFHLRQRCWRRAGAHRAICGAKNPAVAWARELIVGRGVKTGHW